MSLAEDQHAFHDLAAQGADKALAGRFMRGAWTAVRRILAPVAWKTASKERVKFGPRSRIRNPMSSNRSWRLRARLRACCTVHSPVGFAVTPPRCVPQPWVGDGTSHEFDGCAYVRLYSWIAHMFPSRSSKKQ